MKQTLPTSPLSRVLACWPGKVLMLIVLAPVLYVCYLLPQYLPLRTPGTLPLTPLDRAVAFQPGWVYAYVSLYVFLIFPPLFATQTSQLRRYTVGAVLMFAAATVVFVLWPVAYPRPPFPQAAPALYHLVVSIDRPVNSIPSLHAGLIAYSLCFASRIGRDAGPRVRRAILPVGATWGALILYATLATKQHYLLDLPPGALLAWATHAVAWRGATTPVPQLTDPRTDVAGILETI